MQKSSNNFFLSSVIHGIITGIIALVVFFSGIYGVMVYAQANPGGKFGEILNQILASGNWQNPGDGMVKDAQALGGLDVSHFVKKSDTDKECNENQCVVGFTSSGSIICR